MGRKDRIFTRSTNLTDAALCSLASGRSGVKGARIVSPAEVETAAWVRLKCQFGCDGYRQCLVCPPFTTPEQMRQVLNGYRRAILIHFEPQADTKDIVVDLEREVFLRGAWKAFGLGAGPCYLCKTCPAEPGKCRHPEKTRPAMEACGIDVFTTARKAGFPIEVVRTTRQCPNYYGLVLVD
jgi:predicted metal-binding protein